MTAPIVSIVMPTFNRLEFLPATVESVFRQTLREWELVIADDGSDRDVLDYLETLRRDERVNLLPLEHTGNAGRARNHAISVARAPYLAFLDSDDLWEPKKLERQLATMRANPGCGWSYTAFAEVDSGDTPLASERTRRWIPHEGRIFVQTVRTTASIRPSSVVAKTDLVCDAGAFDEAIDCSEDYDLWMRLALMSPVCVNDERLVRVRRHPGNQNREVSRAYVARDYSLRKLAARLDGSERALLEEERSRNALAQAAETAARGWPWRALVPVAKSLPFSWRYPRWWYGVAKAFARACLNPMLRRDQVQ
jgi:glycosyltransferase involved in cell wall biosynthesis